ncbi:MAG: recombinase family protein [Oscillospiraceae bacterium]|nr:recombinase family protein [Oscillospiraceae bacterium]
MARKSRKHIDAPETPKRAAMKVWRAALYIRLSVEFNSNRGDSLETLRQIMEAYIALCPDIEIAGVYTDNGTTGRTFEREAFQRMLADIESGEIDCIIVKDLSRLGRNAIDTGYYIEKYFPLHGVRFIAVNDQYDSEDSENSGNHLIVPWKNMINEAYAADISRKVKAQQRQAMRDGEFVGARPPYGYKKGPDNCHKLLVNEDTAPVVRQIFQWIADGVPLSVVAKRLNDAGVITPGYYSASISPASCNYVAGGGKWQTRSVTKILRDEVYVGDMVQGKHKNVGHKQIPTNPEDWIVVRNTHEPIISRELFEKARAVREEAAAKARLVAPKVPYSENILRGRIFCGHCGKNLHRERDLQRYYYHCLTTQRIGKGICDMTSYLREDDLFHMILTIIRQEAENVIGKSIQLKRCDSKIAEQKKSVEKEISNLRQKTENNRKFLTGLLESFNTGLLTRTEYMDMKANYSQEIAHAVERVQRLQEQQKTLESQMEQYISLADRLAAVSEDTALSALWTN